MTAAVMTFFSPTGMAAAVVTAARDDRGHDDRGLGHPGDDLELKQKCRLAEQMP